MRILSLLLLALPAFARAETARFTTVFLDDEGVVYVGVKHGEPAVSEVISLPFKSGDRTNIPLPAEISARDVIGLIPEKQKLFVLTSGMGAALQKGDGPTLHVYDREFGKWTRVGHVACPAFTKVTMQPRQMVFSCEVGQSKKGRARVVRKGIPFGKNRIYRNGVWRFPEFLLRYKGRTVLLEGPAPTWDRLRLRDAEGERTITAEDLLRLPVKP